MNDDTCIHECEVNFFVHLWLEHGEQPSWRGRISDGKGFYSVAFEDEFALLSFIRSRLPNEPVKLPWRRGKS